MLYMELMNEKKKKKFESLYTRMKMEDYGGNAERSNLCTILFQLLFLDHIWQFPINI